MKHGHRSKYAALWALAATATAWAQPTPEAPWLRCRAIANDAQRLACYDALPPAAPSLASRPAAAAPATTPATPVAPTPSAAAAAPRPPQDSAREAAFGRPAEATQADELRSHLPGRFEGWAPRQRFTLANGQVWQLTEDTRGVYDLRDPKVTIRRGFLGSYVMDIEGVNQLLKVRRLP